MCTIKYKLFIIMFRSCYKSCVVQLRCIWIHLDNTVSSMLLNMNLINYSVKQSLILQLIVRLISVVIICKGEFQDKERLDQFFEARNPKQDPNFTLTNLLSKPVLVIQCATHFGKFSSFFFNFQRLLRYPLFFKAIRDQLDKTSEEIPLLDGI